MKHSYRATFEGRAFTRSSHHVYTHAAIYRNQASGALDATFHGSQAAAARASHSYWSDEAAEALLSPAKRRAGKIIWLKPIAIIPVETA